MSTNRRELLKMAGLTGISVAIGGMLKGYASDHAKNNTQPPKRKPMAAAANNNDSAEQDLSVIGLYGAWADSLSNNQLPSFSYRNEKWTTLDAWQKAAKQRLTERLAIPNIGGLPAVKVKKQYSYDGLHIEELTWQLPYGRPTEAILLKPMGAKGKLPGILAFHDHSANKYFGWQKITRTADHQHPMLKEHQQVEYSGLAWANEIAKRGYVVMVSDAFAFASRRVLLQDVPSRMRKGLNDDDPDNPENIKAYNDWAFEHEHTMAKSLFSAGTTWPGVFFAEDRKALDILYAREDVDPGRIGCGGLSGGGLRTVMLAGLDPRIKCAVDVGFMTSWEDFLLNRSVDHTWMAYIPLLPNELDFPEILGLRTPLPTLVLNNSDDPYYTLPGMQKAEKTLSEVFKKAGAGDHFKCSYYPGPHKFDAAMQAEAFNWFDRWLKA